MLSHRVESAGDEADWRFKPRLLKLGVLPRIRLHDLRHTRAMLLLSEGVYLKQASEMLGHANVCITMTVYAHVLPTMHKEAAAAMESA